jgi:hypothetical protein
MDTVKAGFDHPWLAPLVLVVGLVVAVVPIFMVDGYGGASLQRLGQIMIILACMRIGYLARTDRARATYRYIRCAERTEPVVTLTARDDK